jgi:uncharacterized membrane-anchored protein YhcB (DUF1043 family)
VTTWHYVTQTLALTAIGVPVGMLMVRVINAWIRQDGDRG